MWIFISDLYQNTLVILQHIYMTSYKNMKMKTFGLSKNDERGWWAQWRNFSFTTLKQTKTKWIHLRGSSVFSRETFKQEHYTTFIYIYIIDSGQLSNEINLYQKTWFMNKKKYNLNCAKASSQEPHPAQDAISSKTQRATNKQTSVIVTVNTGSRALGLQRLHQMNDLSHFKHSDFTAWHRKCGVLVSTDMKKKTKWEKKVQQETT